MSEEMNFEIWEKLIQIFSLRRNEEEEKEFLNLLDVPMKWDPKNVAKTLMRTFSNKPDYGTQEKVISKLSEIDPSIYIETLLEELPYLLEQADEWVESLISTEIIHRPILVKNALNKMPNEIKILFYKIIQDPEFRDLYPESEHFQMSDS